LFVKCSQQNEKQEVGEIPDCVHGLFFVDIRIKRQAIHVWSRIDWNLWIFNQFYSPLVLFFIFQVTFCSTEVDAKCDMCHFEKAPFYDCA
jgi:hypothetical protein